MKRLLAAGVLVATTPLAAGQPPAGVFRGGIDTVRLDVSVVRNRKPVRGLAAADFVVTDNGTQQAGSIPQAQAPARPASLAITHVTMFDSMNGSVRTDMTVVMNGDRIVEVASSNSVRVSEAVSTIDGRGKFVLPGLWDMHVHVFNNGEQNGTNSRDYFFPLLVANGIVGVRDMGTDPDDIVEAERWNRDIDAGQLVGPRVLVTSRVVDGEPEMRFRFDSPDRNRTITLTGRVNGDEIAFDRAVELRPGGGPGGRGFFGAAGAASFTARRTR